MSLNDLVIRVPEKWQSDFLSFVDAGKASKEFMAHLELDASLQQVVDEVFVQRASAFDEAMNALRTGTLGPASPPAEAAVAAAAIPVADAIRLTIRAIDQSPEPMRQEVLQAAAIEVAHTEGREKLLETASTIQEAAVAV